MSAEVLRYTAFATHPGGGNPAGVVLDARGLDDDAMLAIAAEVGYSETAFLFPGTDLPGTDLPGTDLPGTDFPDADFPGTDGTSGSDGRVFDVRYFSPQMEVTFCGHATVASAVALAERIGPGEVVFRTKAGEVPVAVREVDGSLSATLTSVEPHTEDATDVDRALALLGWHSDDLDPTLPPRIAYAGARHLVLAAATRRRLADLDYDFDGLAAYMTERDLTTLQLVWRESADTFHVRDPFPVGGVVEDPATGAAAAALGAYLRELAAVPATARLTLHQGDDMGRPGVLTVELMENDARVRVSGNAVPIPA